MKHLEIIEGLGGIFSGEEKRVDVEWMWNVRYQKFSSLILEGRTKISKEVDLESRY